MSTTSKQFGKAILKKERKKRNIKKKTYIWNIKWKLILAMIHRILLRKCSPGSGLHVCTLSIVGLKQPKLHLSNNSKMNNDKTSLFFFSFLFCFGGFFFFFSKRWANMAIELLVPKSVPNSVAIRERKIFFFFLKACGEGKSLGLSEVSQMFGLKVDASVLPKACFKLWFLVLIV